VRGRIAQYTPKVELHGGFVEGEKVTAKITFPDLPSGHGPVSMRFVTQWQREDHGSYWITHGEAMARAKLRQRGHYEAAGEQIFFIPTVDTEPIEAKRFLPIEREEAMLEGSVRRHFVFNTLEYECCKQDIGLRLRFWCQPVDLHGHLGRVFQAVSPHILCPFPKVRSMFIRDVQTGLEIQSSRLREAAAQLKPAPTGELVNRPVKVPAPNPLRDCLQSHTYHAPTHSRMLSAVHRTLTPPDPAPRATHSSLTRDPYAPHSTGPFPPRDSELHWRGRGRQHCKVVPGGVCRHQTRWSNLYRNSRDARRGAGDGSRTRLDPQPSTRNPKPETLNPEH
jgi:hypothetical protein